MSYMDKGIKRDKNNRPIPQYFNATVDDFEDLQGEGGAQFVKDRDVITRLEAIETRLNQTLSMQLMGSNVQEPFPVLSYVKTKRDTIINAQSVVGKGETGWVSLDVTNESYLWIMVTIDKQPWSLYTTRPWSPLRTTKTIYPEQLNVSTTYTINTPSPALLMNVDFSEMVDDYPDNLLDAFKFAGIWVGEGSRRAQLNIENHSTETATISVNLIRVWR